MTDEEHKKDTLDIYTRAVELLNNNMQGDEAELIADKMVNSGGEEVYGIQTNAPTAHIGIAIAQAMSEHPDLSVDDSWEMFPPNEEKASNGFTVYY